MIHPMRVLAPLLAGTLIWLTGCAGTPPPASVDSATDTDTPAKQTTANPLAIYDPMEPLNRRIYRFNALADRYALLPALHAYRTVTPAVARTGIANFFRNLAEITTFANTILQAKPQAATITLSRFLINSTVGLAGLFDPATRLGLARRNEDFGQTLGVYGVETGPYLVLPLLGPSTLRDGIGVGAGFALEFAIDPLSLEGNNVRRVAYWTLYGLNTREQQQFRYYQTGSPFEYTLVRLVYVNRRSLLIEQ